MRASKRHKLHHRGEVGVHETEDAPEAVRAGAAPPRPTTLLDPQSLLIELLFVSLSKEFLDKTRSPQARVDADSAGGPDRGSARGNILRGDRGRPRCGRAQGWAGHACPSGIRGVHHGAHDDMLQEARTCVSAHAHATIDAVTKAELELDRSGMRSDFQRLCCSKEFFCREVELPDDERVAVKAMVKMSAGLRRTFISSMPAAMTLMLSAPLPKPPSTRAQTSAL